MQTTFIRDRYKNYKKRFDIIVARILTSHRGYGLRPCLKNSFALLYFTCFALLCFALQSNTE